MSAGKIIFDGTGIADLKLQIAEARKRIVRVGLLKHTAKRDDGETNPEVGFEQEFGSPHYHETTKAQQLARGRGPMAWPRGFPARSFIRVPMFLFFKPEVETQRETIKEAFKEDGFRGVQNALGAIGVQTMIEAFATAGHGTWEFNSVRTQVWKKSSRPLIDSHQLVDALDWDIK